MAPLWRFRSGSALAALLPLFFSLPLPALELPAGTQIQVRLKTKISTQSSKAGDAFEAVAIAPVMAGGEFAIPAGAVVRGQVVKATQSAKADERSVLLLAFDQIEIAAEKYKMSARVAGVENARESVDAQGQINGIVASETITGRIDAGIQKLSDRYSSFAGILEAAKNAVLKPAESDIAYDAGVEMAIALTAPLKLKAPGGPGPAAKLQPMPDEPALLALVAREPFQTVAQDPPKPSDITNLMLAGTEDDVKQAFTAAGWSAAASLNVEAKFETVRAIAEERGYKEAPVSVLLLDGKPPDMVFEKMNNTFARRHHLRIWRRPGAFDGKPLWAVAATHDTGISFSQENRTFIHRIDSSIDRERSKVVNDLIFTGRVKSLALIDRPQVPRDGQNATGDKLETDGKIAVLLLHVSSASSASLR